MAPKLFLARPLFLGLGEILVVDLTVDGVD